MFFIDLSNVEILVQVCQDLGGMPATVKEFSNPQEQLAFLREPTIVKALQVFYRILPVKSLTWFELEWLQSQHFLDIWHRYQENINRTWIEAHRDLEAEPLRQYLKCHYANPRLTPEERLELTEILFEQGQCCFDAVPRLASMSDRAMVRGACRGGHLSVIKDIERHLGKRHPETLVWASEFGRFDICQFVMEIPNMSENTQRSAITKAIENDHLEVLKYLLTKYSTVLTMPDILNFACFHGSIQILEHYQPKGPENDHNHFCHAAFMHVRTLKWLWLKHKEWSTKALFAGWHATTAVQDSELLQWYLDDPQIGLGIIMDALLISEQWHDFMRLLWQYPTQYQPTAQHIATIVYGAATKMAMNETLEPPLLHALCRYMLKQTGFKADREFWREILEFQSLDVLIYLDQTHCFGGSDWQCADEVLRDRNLDLVIPVAVADWIRAKVQGVSIA